MSVVHFHDWFTSPESTITNNIIFPNLSYPITLCLLLLPFLSSSEILNPLPNCLIFDATILALSSVGCVLLISVLCELIGRHSNRTGRHLTIIKRFSFIITQQVYYINNRNIYIIKKDAKYSIFHDLTLQWNLFAVLKVHSCQISLHLWNTA